MAGTGGLVGELTGTHDQRDVRRQEAGHVHRQHCHYHRRAQQQVRTVGQLHGRAPLVAVHQVHVPAADERRAAPPWCAAWASALHRVPGGARAPAPPPASTSSPSGAKTTTSCPPAPARGEFDGVELAAADLHQVGADEDPHPAGTGRPCAVVTAVTARSVSPSPSSVKARPQPLHRGRRRAARRSADPAAVHGRVAGDEGVGGDVPGDDRAGGGEGVPADRRPADDDRAGAERGAVRRPRCRAGRRGPS